MKIATKTYVFQTLKEYHLIAKKGYGQNFLINENITRGIISNSHINKDSLIIEIGPGLGALTEELLSEYKKVIAIEIDRNMVTVLKDTFIDKHLEIINEDFLRVNLKEIINQNPEFSEVTIVSNLPYYITSDILERIILTKDERIKKVVVMMQKEVGRKLLLKEDNVDSFLKFLIHTYCDIKEVLYVSKNDFIPRPNVDSMVLEIDLKTSKYEFKNEARFFYIFKECLNNKRKILIATLSSVLNKSREEILSVYKQLKLKENARIEELKINEFVELINLIS